MCSGNIVYSTDTDYKIAAVNQHHWLDVAVGFTVAYFSMAVSVWCVCRVLFSPPLPSPPPFFFLQQAFSVQQLLFSSPLSVMGVWVRCGGFMAGLQGMPAMGAVLLH